MSTSQESESDSADSQDIDISLLAEEVYRLLMVEIRIERERQRPMKRPPLHSRRIS
jgi:hypothetical protein